MLDSRGALPGEKIHLTCVVYRSDLEQKFLWFAAPRGHYGTKPGHFETSKILFPTSEGVSEVSERANE